MAEQVKFDSAAVAEAGPWGAEWGRSLREGVPLESHAEYTPADDRPDVIDLITDEDKGRLEVLVPVRHHRMSQSAFTFFRGTAAIMGMDLASTPISRISAQLCGDAHLSNFGTFASPERHLVFDVNDFDETVVGPWEWDLKRLATSFAIAARHLGMSRRKQRKLAKTATEAYRQKMKAFAGEDYLDVWYTQTRVSEIMDELSGDLTKKERKQNQKMVEKAESKDSFHALRKLAEKTDDGYRIVSQEPLIVPLRDITDGQLATGMSLSSIEDVITSQYMQYRETVAQELLPLLNRFRFVDMALKVVGVGSVGQACFVVLLQGRGTGEPFFLQIKQAGDSAIQPYLPEDLFPPPGAPSVAAGEESTDKALLPGQRVVLGQRIMQAASDSFLGWTEKPAGGRYYYWRQFKDMKGSFDVESADYSSLRQYAKLCGFVLARAHAFSGDTAAIAGYLDSGTVFEEAVGDFAVAYADQNDRDYVEFKSAIDLGKLPAYPGVTSV